VLGWHPWAVIRIASFVVIGVVLSMRLVARITRVDPDWPAARRPLVWACAGLIVDVMTKALIAPAWQRLLLHVVGW
jgi:hypothetical protein